MENLMSIGGGVLGFMMGGPPGALLGAGLGDAISGPGSGGQAPGQYKFLKK